MAGVDTLPDDLICSARGCTLPAINDVRWNNAKIHPPERRKHWLACAAHTESLSAYLSAREMLRGVVPLDTDESPVTVTSEVQARPAG